MKSQAELQVAPPSGKTPSKVLLFGVEGIGKTTLAAQFPAPIFIDVEGSTVKMKPQPARMPEAGNYTEIKRQLKQILDFKHNYQTLVIDSVGVLERWIEEFVCASENITSIESMGYGKGYKLVEEEFAKLLDFLDRLINERHMNILLIAHSVTRQATEPGSPTAFDRYEVNLGKKSGPLIKQWADAVLFANYKTVVIEGKGKNAHAVGGKERVLYCNHTAVIDAKNRFGLPDSVPMNIAALKNIFE